MAPLLTRLTPPTGTPVPVEALKVHLRITEADEDAALADLLLRATAMLDGPNGALGRCLMAQTWRVAIPRPAAGRIALPIAPATALRALRRVAPDGSEEALSPADFPLIADADRTILLAPPQGWPAAAARPDAFAFELEAGAADAADVPHDLRQAVLLLAAHWHAQREAAAPGPAPAEIPLGVQHLIALHRCGWAA